jgi:hypothetical protein
MSNYADTPEGWEKYQEAEDRHQQFIKDYRFFLNRILRHLDWMRPANTWTTADIKKAIENEIDRSSSMDAPNKPGYHIANND